MCGKEIVNQFGIFNFYVESLNFPSMLLGIILAVVIYYVYTYCKPNKKLYYQSKISMPVTEYPLWYPEGKK